MGTERSLEYEGKCACGEGFYRVYECSPDHGWPTSQRLWYESSLDCNACSLVYQIERRERAFVVVEQNTVNERTALRHEAYERGQVLMKTPSVLQLLAELEALLLSQSSVAATARLLKRANLSHYSEAAFRNHWSSAGAWVRGNVCHEQLQRVMNLINRHPPEVLTELAEISRRSEAGSLLVAPIAEPFFQLSGPPYA